MDLLDRYLCLTFVGSGKMVQDIIENTWRLSQDPAHWPRIFIRNVFAPVLSSNMVPLKIWACTWLCLDGFFLHCLLRFQGNLSPESCASFCVQRRSRRVESHESIIKIFGSVKHDNTKAVP